MRNALRMVVVALVLCASSVVAHADNFQFWYENTYAGTACNQFAAPGLGPNGGVEIVNWSNPGNVLVDCPFVRDADNDWIAGWAYVDVRGNVSCTLRAVLPNSAGWVFGPASLNFRAGYNELSFNGQWVNANIVGAAIECVIPPGAAISQYRVESQVWSR